MFIYCCTFTIKLVINSPFLVFYCRLKYPIGQVGDEVLINTWFYFWKIREVSSCFSIGEIKRTRVISLWSLRNFLKLCSSFIIFSTFVYNLFLHFQTYKSNLPPACLVLGTGEPWLGPAILRPRRSKAYEWSGRRNCPLLMCPGLP